MAERAFNLDEAIEQARREGRIVSETRVAPIGTPDSTCGKPHVDVPSYLEKDFSAELIEFAQARGWLVAHFRAARVLRNGKETYETPIDGDGKGFLDLFLCRERTIFAELKVKKNTPSEKQEKWIAALKKAKQEVYVWYPKHWSEIRKVLA